MILETIDADIGQLHLLIGYHNKIAADALLYTRPSEGALEGLTSKYLKELKEIREKEGKVLELLSVAEAIELDEHCIKTIKGQTPDGGERIQIGQIKEGGKIKPLFIRLLWKK